MQIVVDVLALVGTTRGSCDVCVASFLVLVDVFQELYI
jgi:hypothetical protein